MNKYENGKIYKIQSHLGDKIYIGSTTNPYLSNRMAKHRNHYKDFQKGTKDYVYVFELFDEYGVANCFISLIENCKCNSKDELNSKEGEYIKSMNCVNKNIAGRKLKDYYIDNRDFMLARSKAHYESVKHKIFECPCGLKVNGLGKTRHQKTDIHLNLMKEKIIT